MSDSPKLFSRALSVPREFSIIQGWQFPVEPFYLAQLGRMLVTDIPYLAIQEQCTVIGYYDPMTPNRQLVGFGTLMIADVHQHFTGLMRHCYIPALALKPDGTTKGRGYGQAIMDHLIERATATVRHNRSSISDLLILDVYVENEAACRCYEKVGFQVLNPNNPVPDPQQDNEPFYVMGRRLPV